MQQVLGFVTIGLLLLDFICIIISLITDYWILSDDEFGTSFRGLWQDCRDNKDDPKTTCDNLSGTADIQIVRATLFLGLILVCGAMVCVMLKVFVLKQKKALLYAAAGLLVIAGLILMTGFAEYHHDVFKRTDKDEDYKLHAGFALCIIAWLVTWAGAGTSVAMASMKE